MNNCLECKMNKIEAVNFRELILRTLLNTQDKLERQNILIQVLLEQITLLEEKKV